MITLKQLAKRFFQYEARLILKKYHPKIIAITGSVGKTTTKDAVYSIISKKFFVRKSEKSFTSGLGVPMTIIGCRYGNGSILEWIRNFFSGLFLIFFKTEYPAWLILELDGDKPGDLEGLSQWLSPDILVITEIGTVPSHIEAFESDLNKFLNEKKHLINSVSRNGVIIYNADDELSGRLVHNISSLTISCGLTSDCNIRSSDFVVLFGSTKKYPTPTGMSFEIFIGNEIYHTTILSSIGSSIQYASLLSIAVANELGISPHESSFLLSKVNFLPGRMNILSGIKDTVIIDDSYNSSPIASKQAIEALLKIETTSRKIVVVGDMLELGKFSAEEHRNIGQLLKEVASFVICVGLRSRRTCQELLSLGFPEELVICFDTSIEAGKYLQNLIQEGDIILIKGSQDMRMERVVEEVMRHPEDKAKLLVRQEPEWLERE